MKDSLQLQVRKAAVKEALGDSVICDLCGCTLATYASKCIAELSDPCPGFMAIDAAELSAARRVKP